MSIKKLIIKQLFKNRVKTKADLALEKRKTAKKHKTQLPSNVELLKAYHGLVKDKTIKPSLKIENLLRTRPVRSLSGIVNISVLTKPYPCPGKCIYCPSQRGTPKSYLNNEPAVMRAILNKYDPYKQVKMRLRALEDTGHPIDKIELRIVGGTWSFYPKKYQTRFIKRCFEACNSKNYTGVDSLLTAQKRNEKAKHRIIGLSVETRPDFINPGEVIRLRKLGVTMVELGVQSIYDDILALNKRGHKVEAIIKATKLLKDAGFKILYQMMPNLPGSNLKRDEKMFKELFSNTDFQPDLLKIYPCAILKEAPLYRWWKNKKYKPYTLANLIDLVRSIKKIVPYYVRIQRIIRDIPSQSIVAGPAKISNLRQVVAEKSKKEKWSCRCIRCREVGENYNPKEKLFFFRQSYEASGGQEIFLSIENNDRTKLYSLLRLRIPVNQYNQYPNNGSRDILPVLREAAIIREVHTYGQLHPIGSPPRSAGSRGPQHKGLGKKLINAAEVIAEKEFAIKKIAVISGIGARAYYRKLGYGLEKEYMVKK